MRVPSCPSCRARCCQPRRGTPQQSWLQLRKYVCQKSISVVLSALWYFIGGVKILVGYLMAFVIYTQGRSYYSSHIFYGHWQLNIFPLTLDLGELDKNGRAEVALLVTIREVIFWYSVSGMIDDWSQILPVCRVLSLTIYPHSLILQTIEFTTLT